jgi:parallel beta-helix repeat protein
LNLSRGGVLGAPVTLTSADPKAPATIYGRVVTHPGAVYLALTNLRFDWDSGGRNLPSITIGSDHVSLTHDDIQNGNSSICVNVIADPLWGTAHETLIDHDRIHNCGLRPVTAFTSPGYFSHALYISGFATTVTNNYIYDNSGKGVLLRGSVGAYVANNTVDDNGTGIAFGDLAASDNDVEHNIITNSNAGCDCNAYGVFAWWGAQPVGSGNAFHDNCLSGNQQGDISVAGGGFSSTSNRIADPLYADATNRRYTLSANSPCLGDGPDSAQPGSADTSPPSVPTGLARSAVTQSSLELAWTASTDDVGVAGYDVYDGGVSVGSATATSFRLSGLACGTLHSLAVVARDAAGNRSAPSSSTSITTSACAPPVSATVTQSVGNGSGSPLAGSIKWNASPIAPASVVTWVYFFLDGALYHAEQYPPYGAPCDTCSFDTATLGDGAHTFTVLAVWADGQAAVASSVRVVANGPAQDPAPADPVEAPASAG